MREELLHFIWRFRYFNQHDLSTEAGEPVTVLLPGEINTHQGPDFHNASIRIGEKLCNGPVELHVRTSDWLRHAHDGDIHYREVILHVVWENDMTDPPGGIPVLVLRHRVSKLLLDRYSQWMKSPAFIPCERRMGQVNAPVWLEWQQRLSQSRLEQRALYIRSCLQENHQHWEETTWWLMARTLGLPVNGKAFEAIARSLPITLLARHRFERIKLEAMLLGQAGLLEEVFAEDYARTLQQEYRFCLLKYNLQPTQIPISCLRMRPGNFPAIRLAQLAGLLSSGPGWFSRTLDAGNPRDLLKDLDIPVTGFWDEHYVLGKKSPVRPKNMGPVIKDSLLINAFIPLLFAYGWLRGEPAFREKALRWLREIRPETNALISGWRRLGIIPSNAAGSQALLELKKNYCNHRKCLDCMIGQTLLGSAGITR